MIVGTARERDARVITFVALSLADVAAMSRGAVLELPGPCPPSASRLNFSVKIFLTPSDDAAATGLEACGLVPGELRRHGPADAPAALRALLGGGGGAPVR